MLCMHVSQKAIAMRKTAALLSLLAGCFAATPTEPVRVGFYQGNGTSHPGANDQFFSTLSMAASSAFGRGRGFHLANLTEPAVAGLSRDAFDVVVFPGGSGNGQAAAIGEAGLEALRAFVASGGGYIGTCGGAFLGLQHAHFYGVGPTGRGPPTQEPFDRGHGPVSVEFSASGLAALRLDPASFGGNVTILYWQGPIVKPADLPANVTRWATFRTEIHSQHTNETRGEMIGTPAFTSIDGYGGAAGGGRVVLNSPHPELTPNLPQIYAGELKWVLRM